MCDCWLCPLTESNTQVCDVLLRRTDTGFRYGVPDKHKDMTPIVTASLMKFALHMMVIHKLEKKQAIGDSCDIDEPTYEFYMKRIMKNVWKICFHAKKVETGEDPT